MRGLGPSTHKELRHSAPNAWALFDAVMGAVTGGRDVPRTLDEVPQWRVGQCTRLTLICARNMAARRNEETPASHADRSKALGRVLVWFDSILARADGWSTHRGDSMARHWPEEWEPPLYFHRESDHACDSFHAALLELGTNGSPYHWRMPEGTPGDWPRTAPPESSPAAHLERLHLFGSASFTFEASILLGMKPWLDVGLNPFDPADYDAWAGICTATVKNLAGRYRGSAAEERGLAMPGFHFPGELHGRLSGEIATMRGAGVPQSPPPQPPRAGSTSRELVRVGVPKQPRQPELQAGRTEQAASRRPC